MTEQRRQTESSRKVLAALDDTMGLRVNQIAEKTGLPVRSVSGIVASMSRSGLIVRTSDGFWRVMKGPME